MHIQYQGKNWLKDGCGQMGMWEFVRLTKARLSQPLPVPEYVAADEALNISRVSEQFQKDPYANRLAFHNRVDQLRSMVSNVRPVPYDENPLLYNEAVFAANRLCNLNPVVYIYTAGKQKGYVYQAFATDYLDKAYIYISDRFFTEGRMLSPIELMFILGHELGHAQCHHVTIRMMTGKDSLRDEYSADRAGLIACGLWIKEKHPELAPDQIGLRCVKACAGALSKLAIGVKAMQEKKIVDWEEFDYQALEYHIQECFRKASSLPKDSGTHPSNEHRFMAATFFTESELFYKYLGFDPAKYSNLRSAQQLENAMGQL